MLANSVPLLKNRVAPGNRADPDSFAESEPSRHHGTAAEMADRIDDVLALLKTLPSQHSGLFPPSGGLEGRIAHLEASTAHLERDVAQMRTDVRDIRERLQRLQERSIHLPTKGQLALVTTAVLGTIVAASALQQQIQTYVTAVF